MIQLSLEQWSAPKMTSFVAMADSATKVLGHIEGLLELNLETMKAALAQAEAGTMRALAVKDPQEFVALQIELCQRAADSMLTYRHRLYEVLIATRDEIDRAAEVENRASQRVQQGLLETMVNAAPSGSAAASLAAWQEVVNATNTFYGSLLSTMAQATQVAESTFNSAATATSNRTRNVPHLSQP